ncbi:MAG: UDP-N-acetylmuramoyl-tripeptide--D-alanyl-D-alanine ligase [Oscillospiraceae bacterium]|nr:UDP-N-acetylmuramoyl-tripeptide--D-alanyl-D-alanine ligase [Oscillospiraceae bacterium]
MTWTLNTLATWCGAEVKPQEKDISVNHITFDSRKVQEGSLFVALCGQRVDGHDFAQSAKEKGAVAVLVEHPVDVEIPQLVVENTAKAFGAMAAGYRKSLPISVVGITGSVGKTSTKEMVAAVLESTYRTSKTKENHNNDLGLPMTILSMEEDTQMAVLEMGMNHFGEMAYLTSIARPNIAVITNIGTAHIEFLGSREGILQAKMEIMQSMDDDAVAVFNGDEPLLWNLKDSEVHKKYYFGVENTACHVVAEDIQPMDGGIRFRVRGFGQEFEVFLPTEGMHTVYNALAAITVGLLRKVKPEKIQIALSNFKNVGMRQKISVEKGMTIIADCYNAGPESMEAALHVLGDHKTEGKRIAVLGDMLELGTRSQAEHYRIGRFAASQADLLYVYGTNSDRMITGAVTGGMEKSCCQHFTTHEAMAEKLRAVAKEGDVLLFKGSRGMRMEHVLQLFLEDHQG